MMFLVLKFGKVWPVRFLSLKNNDDARVQVCQGLARKVFIPERNDDPRMGFIPQKIKN